MTSSPPPEPQSRRRSLGFTEAVGVFVAFAAIGSILFWSLSRERNLLAEGGKLFPLPESSALPTTGLPGLEPEVSPRPTVLASPEQTGLLEDRTEPRAVAPVAPAQRQRVEFSDVSSDYWAYPFIMALAERGIVTGFGDRTFRPQAPVTRAEFAAMTQRAFDRSGQGKSVNYSDIPSGFWASSAIQSATRTGFLEGYPGNVFQPKQQIPRVQVLVALASGLGLKAAPNPSQALGRFQDAQQIPQWATNQVSAATNAGLVVNHPNQNQLNPNRDATRAETAAFIYQALAEAGKVEKVQSQYIVRP